MKRWVGGVVVVVGVIVVAACGGETTVACGTSACGSDEVCVHPCCGGALPGCVAADDAGVCPSGTSKTYALGQCEHGGPGDGPCAPDPCTPPPPYCAPKSSQACTYSSDPQNCYEACA